MTTPRWIPRVAEPEYMDGPDEVAAYDEADFTEVNREFARRIIAIAGRHGRAVDLGTGPACIPLELGALAHGWRIVAVDASHRMLRRARQHLCAAGLAKRVDLVHCDVARFHKRQPGRFDLAISNSLLHHVRDPIGFWRDTARLLRPGGTLVVQDLLRPGSVADVKRLVKRHAADASPLLRELFQRSLLAAYTPPEVEEQLRLAGVRGPRVTPASDRHLLVAGRPEI